MRRLVLFTPILAVAVASASPSGKVIRIERPRSSLKAPPLICTITPDLRGTCLGRQPKLGDMVHLVDESTTIAELEIRKFEPVNTRCETVWKIVTEVKTGSVGSGRSIRAFGVVDPELTPHSTKLPESELGGISLPGGNPHEQVIVGIDRDGDHQADILITAYKCDGSSTEDCLDVWSRDRDKMRRTSQGTNIMTCIP
jgi:hypothetical protein